MSNLNNNNSFSNNHNNPEVDDSSCVFDADTVTSDSFPYTEDHHQQPDEASPPTSISELLRRINSQHRPAEPSTTLTATTISSTEERDISIIHQESSSSSSQQSTTGELKTFEARWRSKFQELCAYKQLYGGTNVLLSRNKSLGTWVYNQRVEYKKFRSNKHSKITNQRIQMLESIDFEWESSYRSWYQTNQSKWNKRFQELCDYKQQYGNTNVPSKSKTHKQLGIWVYTQRKQYRLMTENKRSNITLERIQKLNSIGFRWVCRARVSQVAVR